MVNSILDKAYKTAKKVTFPKDAKIIFFSDLHKGDNSYADDFRHNIQVYKYALQNYFEEGYTYIELGDGIELWENRSFKPIFDSYKPVFDLLESFHREKKTLSLVGKPRHGIQESRSRWSKSCALFFLPKNIRDKDAFFDLEYQEGLLLSFGESDQVDFCHSWASGRLYELQSTGNSTDSLSVISGNMYKSGSASVTLQVRQRIIKVWLRLKES